MPLPSQWNHDLNAISLVKGTGSPPEIYIPLWWYSGSTVGVSVTISGGFTTALQKGAISVSTASNSQCKLHTLNPNWPSTFKFAFECTLSASAGTAYATLLDVTGGSQVVASQVSTTSTTLTVVRSGQFSLTPGHVYAVGVWSSSGGSTASITDASLIVFPS